MLSCALSSWDQTGGSRSGSKEIRRVGGFGVVGADFFDDPKTGISFSLVSLDILLGVNSG